MGNSPVLRVKSSVRNAPSVSQVKVGVGPSCLFRHRHLGVRLDDANDRFEDGFEVFAFVGGESAGDILPHDISWIFATCGTPHFFDNADGFVKETGTGAVQAVPSACHAHVLARAAEGDNIHGFNLAAVHSGDVPVVFHKGQALGGHPNGKRLNFRCPYGSDARKQSTQRKAPGAVKQASEGQSLIRHGALPR